MKQSKGVAWGQNAFSPSNAHFTLGMMEDSCGRYCLAWTTDTEMIEGYDNP